MKEHNEYRSWNAYNVALWIQNDYALYQLATGSLKESNGVLWGAVSKFLRMAPNRTSDGAIFNRLSVTTVLKEMGLECKLGGATAC